MESLSKESTDLKPTITIHKEKEKTNKTKEFEVPRQDRDKEDLIEVKKVVASKPKFEEIKSEKIVKKIEPEKKLEKEVKDEQEKTEFKKYEEKIEPQISTKKIISEEIPAEDRKIKIIDLK